MNPHPLRLRTVRAEDETAFRTAARSFAEVKPVWRFAFAYDESADFDAYVRGMERQARGLDLREGLVPHSFLVGVVGDAIVGRVSVRHKLNDGLARIGGHIGYGVVPSFRRRGYATEMLRQALPIAAALGIERALVTCDVDDVASRRVIEKNGGVFERITDEPDLEVQLRRYWIETAPSGEVLT